MRRLDGVSEHFRRLLRDFFFISGDEYLFGDQVYATDAFGDGMLDLYSSIHFDEIELTSWYRNSKVPAPR